jgi:hypothetical protein
MKLPTIAFTAIAFLSAVGAYAADSPSHYAGQETREIKSLSAEDVRSLLTGKGMGLAKAAELNGYPGPSHVLQFATELQLSESQRTATQALFESMESKAKVLGVSLVEAERELDHLFASKLATPALVAEKLEAIGQLQSKVRGAHLEVHLAQEKLLSPAQIATYAKLRGYVPGESKSHSHEHSR